MSRSHLPFSLPLPKSTRSTFLVPHWLWLVRMPRGIVFWIGFTSGREMDFRRYHPGRQFDLIVSNPPYVPSGEIENLQPEVRDYDPRLALDGGPEGLDFYQLMAAEAGAFLKPGGRMMVEIGDDQSARVCGLFRQHNWVVEAVERDYTGRERILIAAVFAG